MVVDGVSSEWAWVSMGVPQGSILGPLLLVIFVNNLPNAVEECVCFSCCSQLRPLQLTLNFWVMAFPFVSLLF